PRNSKKRGKNVPDLQFPGLAVDPTGEDIEAPTLQLLRDLNLLPEATPGSVTLSGTPESLQVISAGALSLNKWWTSVVTFAGGGGAIWAAIQAYLAKQ